MSSRAELEKIADILDWSEVDGHCAADILAVIFAPEPGIRAQVCLKPLRLQRDRDMVIDEVVEVLHAHIAGTRPFLGLDATSGRAVTMLRPRLPGRGAVEA